MAFVDGTVVNVALPVMQADLRVGVGEAQWIVEAYALLLASLVLVGGALGDRFGRRRMFTAGAALFAVASLACSVAPTPIALIAARGAQGAAAAMLVPGSLALISAAYADGGARGAAIGTWSAASGATSAVGPVLGGWVVAHASWRWLFLLNLPIAAVTVVLARLRVDESRDEMAAEETDVAGAALVTVGLGAIVYALIRAGSGGQMMRAPVIGLAAFGALALAAFVIVEAHRRAPMVPLSLFRSRTFAGANLLTLLLYSALGGGLFFLPFNLIQVQRYTPAAAGASLLPFIVLISAMSRWAGALADRIGPRPLLVAGPAVAGAGFALLAVPTIGGSYVADFLPGIGVLGVGMGITVAPLTATVMGSVERHHAGVASGINNAVSRAAGLLAVAALGVVLAWRFNASLDVALAPLALDSRAAAAVAAERGKMGAAAFPADLEPSVLEALRQAFDLAYVAGFRAVMIGCAVLASLGALAAALLVGSPRIPPPGSAAEP